MANNYTHFPMNGIRYEGKCILSSDMNSASTCLLLKTDKDPTPPSSYHQILLLNTDLKMICKAPARRLKRITPYIVHPDQTGFFKGVFTKSIITNTGLISLIDLINTYHLEAIVVSLIAEKALDRVKGLEIV